MVRPCCLFLLIALAVPAAHADDNLRSTADGHLHFAPESMSSGVQLALWQEADEPTADDPKAASDLQAPDLAADVAPDYGDAGSMRFRVHGGFGMDPDVTENRLGLGGVGWSYFVAEDLSLDVELNALFADQNHEDALAFNFNLLLRWHFWSGEEWSVFFDGGAGMLFSTDDIPASGSSFNFTPQAGFGVSFDVNEQDRLLVGLRWHHISNANTFNENPGRDSLMLWAGYSVPF